MNAPSRWRLTAPALALALGVAALPAPATAAPIGNAVTVAPVGSPVTEAPVGGPVTEAPGGGLPVTAAPVGGPVTEAPGGGPVPSPDTAGPAGDHAPLPSWLFPRRSALPDLLAGPRDPVTRGQLVYANPGPTVFGSGVSGEVAIAGTVPLLVLPAPAGDTLVVGLEGAAFAAFSFDVVTRELVNTDWVFAVPAVWRRDGHWIRLRYYHTSSHLGDEYQRRFGPSSINFSRDGVDLILYTRPPSAPARRLGAGLYGGVLWSVNSHPEEGQVWRGRAGVELDPYGGALLRPYGALDVELEEGSAHGPRWTAQLGLWLPRVQGRPFRLVLEAMTGPSPLGQFTRHRTRRLALGLYWTP